MISPIVAYQSDLVNFACRTRCDCFKSRIKRVLQKPGSIFIDLWRSGELSVSKICSVNRETIQTLSRIISYEEEVLTFALLGGKLHPFSLYYNDSLNKSKEA